MLKILHLPHPVYISFTLCDKFNALGYTLLVIKMKPGVRYHGLKIHWLVKSNINPHVPTIT
jgi:hypothetical protein